MLPPNGTGTVIVLLADVLRWAVVVCCTTPVIIAALRLQRSQHDVGWWTTAVLVASISATADPLAVALRHVDGTLMASFCIG